MSENEQQEVQNARPADKVFASVPRNYKDLSREQQDEWAGRVADALIAKFRPQVEAQRAQQSAQAHAVNSPDVNSPDAPAPKTPTPDDV